MTDWSDLQNVRAEWPADDLDSEADLAAWRRGFEIYDQRDDYGSMMEAGALIARALRHDLYGPGLFTKRDLMETTHRVLFSSAFPPPESKTLDPEAASRLRLALTVVKKEGWQNTEYGGDGGMERFLNASAMVLIWAVSPSFERPWEGDLKAFFARPMQIDAPRAAPDPMPEVRDPAYSARVVDSLHRSTIEAKQGDPAAEARVAGGAASLNGEEEVALGHFERAAELGDVDSMFDAGMTCITLGRESQGLFWLESAAAGGHPSAMFNLGAEAYNRGRADDAADWWQRAAEAGEPAGYASLTQIASEGGDEEAERRWARLGADAGHPFCMMRHGQNLMRAAPEDHDVITNQALPLLKAAGEAGHAGALFLAGIGYGQIGDRQSARVWLLRAEDSGDPDATRVLDEHGLR